MSIFDTRMVFYLSAFKEEEDNIINRSVGENGLNKENFGKEGTVELQVYVHVHGVGGHGGHGHGGVGGRGEGGGAMNHHNNNKENKRIHHANNCTNNYIGFFHLILLVFAFTFACLNCI